MTNAIQVQRQATPWINLVAWVNNECLKLVQANDTFTAYTITRLVRANQPAYEIVHDEVRALVAMYMTGVANYSESYQNWNGETAKTWAPNAQGAIGITAQPTVAAPAQKQIAAPILVSWDK